MKNVAVLTEPINSRMVGQPEVIRFIRQANNCLIQPNRWNNSAASTKIGWAGKCRTTPVCLCGF